MHLHAYEYITATNKSIKEETDSSHLENTHNFFLFLPLPLSACVNSVRIHFLPHSFFAVHYEAHIFKLETTFNTIVSAFFAEKQDL